MNQIPIASPRGLLIDLDGTLAQSLPVLRQVYHAFLARRSIQGSDAEFEQLNGPPLREVVDMLRRRHGLAGAPDELFAEYWSLVRELYPANAVPSSGAGRLLEAAAGWGLAVALVTSAPASLATEFLNAHHLADHFDAVISAEDVLLGKPSPEPYLLALDRLGLAAGEAVAVEDSAGGVRSAADAGLFAVGLAPPDLAHELTEAGASLVVPDLGRVMEALSPLFP